jgi:hypothetical protein
VSHQLRDKQVTIYCYGKRYQRNSDVVLRQPRRRSKTTQQVVCVMAINPLHRSDTGLTILTCTATIDVTMSSDTLFCKGKVITRKHVCTIIYHWKNTSDCFHSQTKQQTVLVVFFACIREGHPELIVSSCFTITQDSYMFLYFLY